MLIIILSLVNRARAFSGAGSGTESEPYIITNINQLQEMNDDLRAWYALGNDIDATDTKNWNAGSGFIPVGTGNPYGDEAFKGHFHGRGYTIANLFIDRPDADYVGLFGCAPSYSIENVGLINVNVTGRDYVGGLIGHTGSGNYRSQCYTTGIVKGSKYIGGLVGINWRTPITDCYSTASVSGSQSVGGLIGAAIGFSGSTSTNAQVTHCYATGLVNNGVSGDYIGGLVGHTVQTDWNSCYWDVETSGQVAGVGGIGKTTAEMKMQATFTGWDFTNVWGIQEGLSYPFLRGIGESPSPPEMPGLLFQYGPDDREIPVGAFIDSGNITFLGVVNDPDGDRVKLQIELRELDEYEGYNTPQKLGA